MSTRLRNAGRSCIRQMTYAMTYDTTLPASYAIPARQPGETATAYVDRVRQLLRRASDGGADLWKRVYDGALRETYAARDMDAFTAIASLGAVLLEAQARQDEAIDQLDFAISMAGGDEPATAYLMCSKGVYEALLGRSGAARRTVAAAGRLAAQDGGNRIVVRHQSSAAVIDCISLRRVKPESITDVIAIAERAGFDAEGGALKTWAIPYLFAIGRAGAARPWIDALRLQAEAVGHPARLQDAEVFAYASAVAAHREASITPVPPLIEQAANPNAEWRHRLLSLRMALLLEQWDKAGELSDLLAAGQPRFPTGMEIGANPFADLVGAYRDGDTERVTLAPPAFVTLGNLASVLAGMEAVAIGGSQRTAAEWLDQTTGLLPALVHTALEWPVMASRVRGLLHVRAGSIVAGASLLRRAVGLALSDGNLVEAGLAQLQLSEVISLGQVKAARFGEARLMRREGWDRLVRAGISPIPLAYSASRVVGLHHDERAVGNLSPRETEVLSLLSEGLTYKEIGERLEISWRTAQLHAARVYAKLGVHGRVRAIEMAREMKIL